MQAGMWHSRITSALPDMKNMFISSPLKSLHLVANEISIERRCSLRVFIELQRRLT